MAKNAVDTIQDFSGEINMNHKPVRLMCWFIISLSSLASFFVPLAQAQDEAAVSSAAPIYIPLKPPFVVNYGGAGRLKYLKAELSVRVQDTDAASAVRHHMPYIRNNLVLLFSRQTDEILDTQAGKESLRQAALEQVRTVIEAESGNTGVIDLYFENFIVQK